MRENWCKCRDSRDSGATARILAPHGYDGFRARPGGKPEPTATRPRCSADSATTAHRLIAPRPPPAPLSRTGPRGPALAGHAGLEATIYNTLNLFAASGLIRQLSVGNDRCWFDSNTDAHYHFHDLDTGALLDVSLRDVEFQRLPEPPPGMQVDGIELVIRLRRKVA